MSKNKDAKSAAFFFYIIKWDPYKFFLEVAMGEVQEWGRVTFRPNLFRVVGNGFHCLLTCPRLILK